MKEDIDIHLRNINDNKAFWKSCADNPELMKEIDRAKTEKWIPLEEAANELELLLNPGTSTYNISGNTSISPPPVVEVSSITIEPELSNQTADE